MARRPPDPDAPLDHALARARPVTGAGLAREVRVRGVLDALFGDVAPVRVGGYEIVERIGAGGMGVVYRARDAGGAEVAVKVLERGDPKDRERFGREARLLASVRHPHVVRYLDHGETEDGTPFLVMELLRGEDLAARIARAPLAVPEALGLAARLCAGLGAAHDVGVVHRDVKPGNVFLVDGRLDDPRVVDLGVARRTERTHRFTSTGGAVGTPAYMAPEQLRGEDEVRSDVYGLGATLFEALTGHPPFRGPHPAAVLLAVMSEPAPELSTLRPDVPPDVSELVARMLAKDPADRPRDLAAVAADLALVEADRRRTGLSRAERRPTRRADRADDAPVGALLGRGAERHLALAEVARSVEEHVAVDVAVRGEAGVGRSVFARAVSDDVAREWPGAVRIVGRAGPEDTGAPFATFRALFPPNGPWAEVARWVARAGEGDAADPLALADRIHVAWLDAVDAATAQGPLVVILDDADRADLATTRLLRRALEQSSDRPLAVVRTVCTHRGAARGDGPVVELGPLGPRALTRLARQWAPQAAPAALDALCRRSAGNPGLLRDLCRVADVAGQAPAGPVAELVWRAFDRLDPERRRVLRAAAIAGDGPVDALRAVLGDDDEPGLARRLDGLVADGWLTADSARFAFASERARLAATESATDADRARGHARAAAWLAARDGADPAVVARHWLAAGDRDAAVPPLLAAARAALAGHDGAAFDAIGADLHAAAPDHPELDALLAHAAFWRGQLPLARDAAARAVLRAPVGDPSWFRAQSVVITAAGQAGDHAAVRAAAEAVAAAQAPGDDRVAALGRAVTQLAVIGAPPPVVAEAFHQAAPSAVGPEARAWVARARGAQGTFGFDGFIEAYSAAHRAHREAGDERAAAQMGLYLTSCAVWSGAFERAWDAVEDALRVARRLDADYLVVWGRYAEAKLLVETAAWPDARDALDDVILRATTSPRIVAGAWVWRAIGALKAGDVDEASHSADQAIDAHDSPAVRSPALAARLLADVRAGRRDAARRGRAALAAAPAPHVEFMEWFALGDVEAALALDDPDADAARAAARARLDARAATLADPLRRNDYLVRPWAASRLDAITSGRAAVTSGGGP
jgi:hypothetical protein